MDLRKKQITRTQTKGAGSLGPKTFVSIFAGRAIEDLNIVILRCSGGMGTAWGVYVA